MATLKIKSKRTDVKMIGTYVSGKVSGYISLYALAYGVNKSNMFNELINNWIETQRLREPDHILISKLTKRIQDLWDAKLKKEPDIDIDSFKEEIKQELLKKGVLAGYIELILKDVN
jgi:hypothetical protein